MIAKSLLAVAIVAAIFAVSFAVSVVEQQSVNAQQVREPRDPVIREPREPRDPVIRDPVIRD